jgi:hypothetical protein
VIGRLAVPLLLNLALALAGLGLLRLVGHLTVVTPARLFYAGGLGYLIGIAAVMQSCVLLLVIGVPFGIWTVVALCALFASPLLRELAASHAWRPRSEPLARWARGAWSEHRLVVVTMTAFAVLALVGLLTVGNHPLQPSDYDAWDLWARKAGYMYFHSQLPLAAFSSSATGPIHPDYPMLLPLLEGLEFRAISRFEVSSVHLVVWLLMIGFVWAGVYLTARRGRALIGALLFTGAALSMTGQLLTAYADVPMALFLCLGVLELGIWLEFGDRSDLAVAALLLIGAAGIKNEGIFGTIAALLVALVVVGIVYRERLRELAIAAIAVVALGILPWRVWVAANHLKAQLSLSQGLDPSFLVGRVDRLSPSINSIYEQLTNVQSIAVLVPIAIAVAIVALRRRGGRSPAMFYLAVGGAYFASLVWAYVISPLTIQFQIDTSVTRIYIGVAVIALAALVQLGCLDRSDSEPASG